MNVDDALTIGRTVAAEVRRGRAASATQQAANVLADEVERLRNELIKANAEQERLEDQLDSVRGELVATCARIEAWDETLAAVLPSLEQQMTPGRPRGIDAQWIADYIRDLP